MLSIVICSVNSKILEKIKENIDKTIGIVTYEIVVIDNIISEYSIAEAYNHGILESKFPLLLFIHEDITFRTSGWGQILISYFDDPEVGLIGIAGSKVKTRVPSGWWENEPKNWIINLIQHYPGGRQEKIFRGFSGSSLVEAVVVDGVFLGMRKTSSIRFDQRLKGFHNYDQSVSLLFRELGYKVYVTGEILVEHFSIGKKDFSWVDSNFQFFRLYRHCLPQTVKEEITKEDKLYSYMRLIYNFRDNRRSLAFKYWLYYLRLDPFSRKNLRHLRAIID